MEYAINPYSDAHPYDFSIQKNQENMELLFLNC